MIRSIVSVLLLLVLPAIAEGGLTECIHATCRIRVKEGNKEGVGTGVVFEHSNNGVYILTCAHVVGEAQTVLCEFWRDGHQSAPLTAYVVVRPQNRETDAVIVGIREEAFEGRLPDVIPLGDENFEVKPGSAITSVGCAAGAWPTAWRGVALGYSGDHLYFVPAPMEGRSGSALFDADGTRVVGLIRARTSEQGNSTGLAVPLKAIYGSLRQRLEKMSGGIFGIGIGIGGACGPGGCGPGGCPRPQPQPRRPLAPVQPDPVRPGSGAWPTLPPPSLAPPAPVPPQPTQPNVTPGVTPNPDWTPSPTQPIATPVPSASSTDVAALQTDLARVKESLAALPVRIEGVEKLVQAIQAALNQKATPEQLSAIAQALAELRERLGAQSQALAEQQAKTAPEAIKAIASTVLGTAATTATNPSIWAGLLGAIGWTGPPAAAAAIAIPLILRLLQRRASQAGILAPAAPTGSVSVSTQMPLQGQPPAPPIVVRQEGPPGQTQVVHERRYVQVPGGNDQLEALNWALDDYAQRFPGSVAAVQAIRSGADQFLSGKRRQA